MLPATATMLAGNKARSAQCDVRLSIKSAGWMKEKVAGTQVGLGGCRGGSGLAGWGWTDMRQAGDPAACKTDQALAWCHREIGASAPLHYPLS